MYRVDNYADVPSFNNCHQVLQATPTTTTAAPTKQPDQVGIMGAMKDYTSAAIMFNLQILPESLICGIIILAIILGNPAIAAVAAGAAGTQMLTCAVGRIIMNFMPENAVVTSSNDMCHTGYVGKSWARLVRGTAAPELLWHPKAPSIYLATLGFFAGWGWAVQQLYNDEVNAGVLKKGMLATLAVLSLVVLGTGIAFRIMSGCDTIMGAIAGALLGVAIGYFGAISLGYATGRKATNIWGIPLLSDRVNSGAPLYVCPPSV